MSIATRPVLASALLGLLCGAAQIGCVVDRSADEMAHVRVITNGVTTQTSTVDFIIESTTYDFIATGTADTDSADLTITVRDAEGSDVASAQLSLPLLDANASPGDTGSGSARGVIVEPGVQSVAIDFRWQGATPAADVALHVSFYDNPDILQWTAEPAPPVDPATSVHAAVEAVNNEGAQAEMTVSAQFISALDGHVLNAVTLSLGRNGLFEGDIEAPAHSGDHALRIVATDNTGGVTQHERIHAVR